MGTRLWTEGTGESKTGGVPPIPETAERLVVLWTRPPEPAMSLPRTVAQVLDHHVTLTLESLDRVYLNVYQPELQTPRAVFHFLRDHYGQGAVSSHQMKQITERFLDGIHHFAADHQIPILSFEKGQRKEDLAAEYLAQSSATEGVLFIGKAQEKVRTFRTEGRRNADGQTYPWIVESTAMVNQYYFYAVDVDFGPFFLKYSSYFPYGAKLCFNGHEYLKRQLTKEGIGYEALANGILSCDNPKRMQELADGLTPARILLFLSKWQNRLPGPFTMDEQRAGYRYQVSISQVEFARTQVLDRPVHGRIFFEEIVRENIDLGRPDNLQLIFARRVTKRTPGPFRTRVVREGVIPSLYVDYKSSRLKQYFKEGHALRTELTVNNAGEFGLGRRLENLPALRELGFQATRRLLDVETTSQDFAFSEEVFREVTSPCRVDQQRASALRFGDELVQALLSVLLVFRLLPRGFRSGDLREHLAPLLGDDPSQWTQGRLTYQLRRLRLHGLIERAPGSHRYTVTEKGLRVAMWFTRCQARLFRPALGELFAEEIPEDSRLRRALDRFDQEVNRYIEKAKVPVAA
jgi:hypothetical protein